jgi:hypothetical protein
LQLDLLVPGTHSQHDGGDPKKKNRDFFGYRGWGFVLNSVQSDAAPALRGRFFH